MSSILHAKSVTVADWSGVVTVGNSTGGTTTDQASNLARPSDWNADHLFTLSATDLGSFFQANNGLTVTTNTAGVTYGMDSIEFYEPFMLLNANVGNIATSFDYGLYYS